MSGTDSVLVTGGAGFIGSHACKALAAAGFRPVVVDNLSTGHGEAVRWGPLHRVDIRDQAALAEVFAAERPQAVMHFAAAAYVGQSVEDPAFYYDNNVVGMIRLLDTCREFRVGQVIFSSSCATYGQPTQMPIREDTPQEPINPYGRTKLMCEHILRDYVAAFGLQSVGLRYFNAAGADPAGELVENHAPETHLIPLALMAASGQRPPLQVFGTDYPTPDGTCVRDYVHVADLAAAHVAALGYLRAGGAPDNFNLGTGRGYSILEIAAEIGRLFGRRLPWQAAARRPGDPPALVADTARAASVLRVRPQHSDINSILRDAGQAFGLSARAMADA